MTKKNINILLLMLLILVFASIFEVLFSFVYLVFFAYIKMYSVEFSFLTMYDCTFMYIILALIIAMLDYLTVKVTYWVNKKYFVTTPEIAKIFGYFVFSGFTLYKLLATILDMKVNAVTLISSIVVLIILFVANDSNFNLYIDNYDMDIDINIIPGKIVDNPNQNYTMEQIQAMNERNMENSNTINNNNNNGLNS